MNTETITRDVTIYDIASHLGVATSTVSRGLQNHPAISHHTRKKVLAAAEELGYRRNAYAGSLRSTKTRTIGVMLHELKSQLTNSILAGIGKVANEAGYDIIVSYSAGNSDKEAANARNLLSRKVDGIIATVRTDAKDISHFHPFQEKKIPVIFFDRTEDYRGSTMVGIDNISCAYQATRHLAQQGCRKIALVTGSRGNNIYEQRYKGYLNALQDSNLPFDKSLVIFRNMDEAGGVAAAEAIMQMTSRPDAAFITDDRCASACMHTLAENGWRIPEDIAIVGFNNEFISTAVRPQLTTIQYPGTEMGEIAARSIIDHLEGRCSIDEASRIVLKSPLIIRGSSKKG